MLLKITLEYWTWNFSHESFLLLKRFSVLPLVQELAELVHRVHLLCMLARGRLIDRACDDPLIQVVSC
jgi:hypothetical protein